MPIQLWDVTQPRRATEPGHATERVDPKDALRWRSQTRRTTSTRLQFCDPFGRGKASGSGAGWWVPGLGRVGIPWG